MVGEAAVDLPVVAITMGDPAGIGPEIIVLALGDPRIRAICRPIVVGDAAIMEAAGRIVASTLRINSVSGPDDAAADPTCIDVIDLDNIDDVDIGGRTRGISADVGRAAYEYLERATRLALDGGVAAIATAPLNKEALSLAGWHGVGHTELLASLTGVPESKVAMMLASDRLRVVHVSTHVSLRQAIALVTTERVAETGRLASAAVQAIVGRSPSVGVCGLNPHGGEHGLFGSEEGHEILPAIEALRSEGLDVTGPLSPDTAFLRAIDGEFDVVIAMYHDQGHIPSKFAAFHDTVNVTLGLPIVRTSVDHGTAYDLAGTGMADARNMKAAIRLAAQMGRGIR